MWKQLKIKKKKKKIFSDKGLTSKQTIFHSSSGKANWRLVNMMMRVFQSCVYIRTNAAKS